MRRLQFIPALALALSAMTGLVAQTSSVTPRTPPTPAQIVANKVAHLTTLLTLTTEQQTQATTIFTTEETSVSGLRTTMQTAHTALKTAVAANDTAGISTAATQIGTVTTERVLAEATADAAFLAILTPDQQTRYNELLSSAFGGLEGGHGPRGHR